MLAEQAPQRGLKGLEVAVGQRIRIAVRNQSSFALLDTGMTGIEAPTSGPSTPVNFALALDTALS